MGVDLLGSRHEAQQSSARVVGLHTTAGGHAPADGAVEEPGLRRRPDPLGPVRAAKQGDGEHQHLW